MSQPFPPASPPLGPRERFGKNQNGWLFQGFSADSHVLWLGGHINAEGEKYESLLLHWNKLHCSLSHSRCFLAWLFLCFIPHAILLVSVLVLSVCAQSPLTNSKLKLYAFPFMNVPSLAESHVQLWMNCCNILAAVYLVFCSLCWLVPTERQTKHSGGCQFMLFFFSSNRLLN